LIKDREPYLSFEIIAESNAGSFFGVLVLLAVGIAFFLPK